MSTLSSRLGLYLPAGTENVGRVTDLINNWEKLEDLVGLTLATSSVAPSSPFQGQFRLNTDNHRSYIYDQTAWQEFATTSTKCGSTIGWGTPGDANAKIQINPNGKLEMGVGGGTAVDVNLYRSAANTLKTDDTLSVAGGTLGIVDVYDASCTSGNTLGTSLTDVVGASVTVVTTRANAIAVILATFDCGCNAFTTANTILGSVLVDGVAQSAQVVMQVAAVNDRFTLTQRYAVTLASAGSHVIKLQAMKSSASNTNVIRTGHTGITVMAFNAGV